MPTPLTEHVTDWRTPTLHIDAERRLVANVALTGATSRNGYRYTEAALREAAPKYDNKPVFLDHPRAPGKPLDRSARDLVGSIINPRFEEGRIRGDIQALDTDAGRTFLALAQAEQPAVGMSHVVLADRSENTVDRIHEVISVDAVVFPATTQTLREHNSGSPPSEGGAGGVALETESRPRVQPAINNLPSHPQFDIPPQSPAPPWPVPVEPLLQLDAGHAARLAHGPPSPVERAGSSHTLREAQARLPPAAITPLFEQQIREAPDESARQALINDRLALLERLTPRTTSPLRLEQGPALSDNQILQTLRRR